MNFNNSSRWLRTVLLTLTLGISSGVLAATALANDSFQRGIAAYKQKDFPQAARQFSESIRTNSAAGTFLNLGNASWEAERPAEAILAWERALNVNPFDPGAENNLQFARERAQLEAPELTWYEIASTWLPANTWAWLAFGSLWFAVALAMMPGILRRRKSATQQALVALGLGIFLLSLPANVGIVTRQKIGFTLAAETLLRFTPTAEAEAITQLAAGEPGRLLQVRGKYMLVQTRRNRGWIQRDQFELIYPRPAAVVDDEIQLYKPPAAMPR